MRKAKIQPVVQSTTKKEARARSEAREVEIFTVCHSDTLRIYGVRNARFGDRPVTAPHFYSRTLAERWIAQRPEYREVK